MNYLKCDAEGCDHREEVETITESDIGRPCPKCGANLLTEEDFRAFAPLNAIMLAFKKLGLTVEPGESSEGAVMIDIHHHNGITTIKETKTG